MAIEKITLEQFDHMGVDPQTLKLYWDNQEVVTMLALPWAVDTSKAKISMATCRCIPKP